jgi:hypothetical protein
LIAAKKCERIYEKEPKMSLTTVFAKVMIQGTHFFKDAPDEVAYLSHPHRHIFHIRAFKKVHHDNRDVEFIMLKNEIGAYLASKYTDPVTHICDFGFRSCEMLAKEIITQFRLHKCEISEDGENGVLVEV